MSKLTEYLKLIPKGLSNPDKIIEGWLTDAKLENGSLTQQEEETILTRRSICEHCTLNSQNAKTSEEYLDLFGVNYSTKVTTLHCSICSCLIKKKTACLSCQCGLEEYNIKYPQNKQPLKWK